MTTTDRRAERRAIRDGVIALAPIVLIWLIDVPPGMLWFLFAIAVGWTCGDRLGACLRVLIIARDERRQIRTAERMLGHRMTDWQRDALRTALREGGPL